MAIKFSSEVLQKEGRLKDGKVTYDINVTLVNNELTRLYCGIKKNTDTDADDNIAESQQIGQVWKAGMRDSTGRKSYSAPYHVSADTRRGNYKRTRNRNHR